MIEKARNKLDQEINIIDIVKSRRYISMALRHLLPQRKRQELLEKSQYIKIFPSSDGEVEVPAANLVKQAQDNSMQNNDTTIN